jgi:hypothetical protein
MKGPWHRHFFYRKQVVKTTWKFRLLVLLVLSALVILPRGFWARKIGQSLVCAEQVVPSDALVLENFDISYLVFERARNLKKAGIAPRVLIPTEGDSPVAREFVVTTARLSRLQDFEMIPFDVQEPVSLNAAKQIRDFLVKENIKSMVIIAPGFRSRRSEMVYKSVLEPAGIRVGCSPILQGDPIEKWTSTWHGIQRAVEQFGKLQYYRFYVLR